MIDSKSIYTLELGVFLLWLYWRKNVLIIINHVWKQITFNSLKKQTEICTVKNPSLHFKLHPSLHLTAGFVLKNSLLMPPV